MSIIGRIFLGLLGIGMGVLVVFKAEWILHNVGKIGWIEQHLGSFGGSRLFYKLLGIVIIVLSTLYMTGFLQDFLPTFLQGMFGGGLQK